MRIAETICKQYSIDVMHNHCNGWSVILSTAQSLGHIVSGPRVTWLLADSAQTCLKSFRLSAPLPNLGKPLYPPTPTPTHIQIYLLFSCGVYQAAAMYGVLGVKPPPIADEKLELQSEFSVILAQVRCVYYSRLNTYFSRLNPNICITCIEPPHDVNHIFACPLKLTHLTPLSLWSEPV